MDPANDQDQPASRPPSPYSILGRPELAGLFTWRPFLEASRAALLKAIAAMEKPRLQPPPDAAELVERAGELGGDIYAIEAELIGLLLEMFRLALKDDGFRVRLSQLFAECPPVEALIEQFGYLRRDVDAIAERLAALAAGRGAAA